MTTKPAPLAGRSGPFQFGAVLKSQAILESLRRATRSPWFSLGEWGAPCRAEALACPAPSRSAGLPQPWREHRASHAPPPSPPAGVPSHLLAFSDSVVASAELRGKDEGWRGGDGRRRGPGWERGDGRSEFMWGTLELTSQRGTEQHVGRRVRGMAAGARELRPEVDSTPAAPGGTGLRRPPSSKSLGLRSSS